MPQIRTDGVVTNYDQTGSGPPLVLLHGAEADLTMFAALAPPLAKSFSVITPDQRDSGMTMNPSDAYGLNDLADDTAALIRGLGLSRAHVFGTSFGGLIAQVLAARHPEVIDSLVLSSTWRVNTSPLAFAPEVFGALATLRKDMAANASEIASYFLSPEILQKRPDLIDIFRGSKRDAAQAMRRGAVLAMPADDNLRSFARPTLILVGDRDRLIPNRETLAITGAVPHAQTHTIAGGSHIASIEMPHSVADAVLAFLAEDRSDARQQLVPGG